MHSVATGTANCAIASGVPRSRSLRTSAPESRNRPTRSLPRRRKKCDDTISIPQVCEMPVATAAPISPFCSGNTNSQSRKILMTVETIEATLTSTGEPSLRQ